MSILHSFGVHAGAGHYFEEAIYTLALIYNTINSRVSSYLREFDLTPGKLNILLVIKHQGGSQGISQVDVSKHLIVTPSNMSKLIDKLQKEGLVSRLAREGDRRVHVLKITEKGSALLSKVWGGYNDTLKSAYTMLPENKQKELAGLLLDWFEAVRKRR